MPKAKKEIPHYGNNPKKEANEKKRETGRSKWNRKRNPKSKTSAWKKTKKPLYYSDIIGMFEQKCQPNRRKK